MVSSGTVIVTGASRGIGAAIVRSLRVQNVRVVGVARSEFPLKALAAEKIGPGQLIPIIGDVCDGETIKSAVQAATQDSNAPLKGLILNAATPAPFGKISKVDIQGWSEALNVNVVSQLRLVQLALPHLRENKGRVIFVSTGLAEMPFSGWSSYCASKAAGNMMIKCLAAEEPEVTVMCVKPGIVDTQMVQSVLENEEHIDPSQLNSMQSMPKLKPEEPAAVLAKLILEAPKEYSGKFFSFSQLPK